MRDFHSAIELAGTSELAGHAGNRNRYITYIREHDPYTRSTFVRVRMFSTDIVEFWPTYAVVRTGGFNTPSTFDGIATALGVPRAMVGTRNHVPFVLGRKLDGDVVLSYNL